MKIKKGSVAIYVLALMLVTAGYWNYISNESQTIETVSISQNQNDTETRDEHLGDATLVSNNELINEENANLENENKEETTETSISEDEYFQESKMSRDTMYSQTLETYQNILNNSNVSEEQKAIVTQEITELNREKNAIMICENLISTKGFSNCVIFVNLESISVIVESEELKADEIAQIQNIISREMEAKVENIHIMTK
ncbi:MAG: SpoIIIAH-like family protein [Clostridia bacterium]|nr:SpoIIIAH-like family protein [Clostridia bacterium]